jgi:adenylate cyclase
MIELVLVNPDQKHERFQFVSGPIELGRENPRTLPRVVVNDRFTSRHQVLIDDATDGQLRIENITDNPGRPVRLSNGVTLANGEKAFVKPPVRLFFGKTTVDLRLIDSASGVEDGPFQTIQRSFLARGDTDAANHTIARAEGPPTAERLTEWFESLLKVQRAAAGSAEFYEEAAKAVVNMIGLDRGMVILREEGKWKQRAGYARIEDDRRGYSSTVLDKVARDKQTMYQSFTGGSELVSLMGVQAVVASPIFDEQDEVIGAIYGSRDMRASSSASGVRPLEAQFVQVLAGMVSAGLMRAAREAEAARMRVQFEGFFSKPLAEALERDRTLLDARKRELTMLFLDLRGFSKIAERAQAGETYQFLSECLNRFTETVMAQNGVVIDYYGDCFAAMWNAPLDQPRHAELAARSALEVLTIVPELNDKYSQVLGARVNIGIGIHTGEAQVGNSGSAHRLKYGPRGHAVNLTSRVESATKVVGVPCLLTGATRQELAVEMQVRRICKARLSGMTEAVDLYELGGNDPSNNWLALRRDYEEALEHYETGRYEQCLQCCAKIVAHNATDNATRWLLTQANQRLSHPEATPDPVFRFEGK